MTDWLVRRAGADVLAAFNGERGAQVFRACAACHTLTPSDGNRAGPTLHGIFGRRIANYDHPDAIMTGVRALACSATNATLSDGTRITAKAVIDALKSKKIGLLGLDVYEQEADLFFKDLSEEMIADEVFQRLLTFPNVLITGHQAFFTQEAVNENKKLHNK